MTVFWSSPAHTFIGSGEVDRFDPGTGSQRYERAADWLASAKHRLAFASFTFDPEDGGSVVVSPSDVSAEKSHVDVQPAADPKLQMVEDGRESWEHGYAEMSKALDAGAVRKVVLARQVTLAGQPDPMIVLDRLAAANPGTNVFSIDGLMGASPEMLISVEHGRLVSQAVAGTATEARGLDDAVVEVEHQLAAESVLHGLEPHVSTIGMNRSIIEVGAIKHLATTFAASTDRGVLEILHTLHPTAAVAGTPRDAAMSLIRRHEPHPRGRYAGPVGWFDREGNGEFALALRCGWLGRGRAVLYAGGGLVAGSDRDREWEETELKLRPMLDALGLEGLDQ
jgi:menaquinone-specific isochorismate synthase